MDTTHYSISVKPSSNDPFALQETDMGKDSDSDPIPVVGG